MAKHITRLSIIESTDDVLRMIILKLPKLNISHTTSEHTNTSRISATWTITGVTIKNIAAIPKKPVPPFKIPRLDLMVE